MINAKTIKDIISYFKLRTKNKMGKKDNKTATHTAN